MPIALAKNEFVQVTVHQLVVDALSQQPVVSLTDPDEKRVLLISIGHAEARAIFLELQGIEHLRPLTHDLLESIIQKVDGKIRKIFITHIKKSVFYATIVIEKNGGLLFDQFHHLGADFRRYYSFQIWNKRIMFCLSITESCAFGESLSFAFRAKGYKRNQDNGIRIKHGRSRNHICRFGKKDYREKVKLGQF